MLQSACIHKMQTQIKHPVNRQKPNILGNLKPPSLTVYNVYLSNCRKVDLQSQRYLKVNCNSLFNLKE